MDEATVTQKTERIDLLNRQELVNQIITVATALSDRKKNACYAINGAWGVGKSFVLDMFVEQAKEIGVEGEELPRFLIFRYNCWEYDYYKEPLVAIVASMLDQISENVNLLSDDVKVGTVGVLKAIGKGFAKSAIHVLAEKVGISPEELIETVKDGFSTATTDIEDVHDYDQYFDFKKNLKALQDTVGSLSKNQTVVFVVDELDRCLPEYTIKVLERLHHLFDGIPNTQVILSIASTQLDHVVHKIFGEKTDAKEYLRKFIDFKIELDVGKITDKFNERFQSYSELFSNQSRYISAYEVNKFKTRILDGFGMRHRIKIVERCEVLHRILIGEKTVDASYMCMEILFAILSEMGLDVEYANIHFTITNTHNLFPLKTGDIPPSLQWLSKLYYNNQSLLQETLGNFGANILIKTALIKTDCLLGVLLYLYRIIIGFKHDSCSESLDIDLIDYSEKYWNLLQVVST